MSTDTLLAATAGAAAVLGFWTMIRFPLFGPRTLIGAAANAVVALGANAVAPTFVAWVAGSVHGGAYLALFGIVLPALAYAFWAVGRLVGTAQRAVAGER
jgi:hypothetical protein